MNFQLLPVLRTVTDRVSDALDVSTCSGETWIVCFTHAFDMHHSGAIDATLTAGAGPFAQLQLYSVTHQAIWDYRDHRLTGTVNIGFGTRPAGRYQFRIVGRVATRIPFTLTVTHPN